MIIIVISRKRIRTTRRITRRITRMTTRRTKRRIIYDIIILIHTKDDESHTLHALAEVLGVVGELVQPGLA
jgi:hypothetical protein